MLPWFTVHVPEHWRGTTFKCTMFLRSVGVFINLSLEWDLSQKWMNEGSLFSGEILVQTLLNVFSWSVYMGRQMWTGSSKSPSKKGRVAVVKCGCGFFDKSFLEKWSLYPLSMNPGEHVTEVSEVVLLTSAARSEKCISLQWWWLEPSLFQCWDT